MNEIEEFEKAVEKVNRNKYHICRECGFKEDGSFGLTKWTIFLKDMPSNEYFSANNKAILSSEYGDTLEDIKNIIEEK